MCSNSPFTHVWQVFKDDAVWFLYFFCVEKSAHGRTLLNLLIKFALFTAVQAVQLPDPHAQTLEIRVQTPLLVIS